MRRTMIVILVMVFVAVGASSAIARPFPITDVRALGMGGSFVAAGEGISAVNYNPALLGEDKTFQVFAPNVIVRIEDHLGLEDLIDTLNASATTSTQATTILNQLAGGGAVDIEAYAGAGVGFEALGIGVGVSYLNLISGTAYPSITDTTFPFDAGSDTLQFAGMQNKQVILTGAKSFGNISVGINMRNMNATIFTDSADLFSDPDIGVGDVSEGSEVSKSAVAFDVGALINLMPTVDVGIVGRDVNSPDLDVTGFKFEPRYRAGIAVKLPLLTFAADFDITEDATIGDSKYKEWAVGAEFDIWAVALRTGMSKNTGIGGAPTLIHFGLGLGFLDIGAAYANGSDYYIAGANLGFGF